MHLQNVVMQLRKVCSHPFLFDWPLDSWTQQPVVDEQLVDAASGKMMVLGRTCRLRIGRTVSSRRSRCSSSGWSAYTPSRAKSRSVHRRKCQLEALVIAKGVCPTVRACVC